MRILFAAVLGALALPLGSAAALAFSDVPGPSGSNAQSQFTDPDEAVENLANGGGSSGTEIGTGAQVPSGAVLGKSPPATALDAEPINPAWPAWMVWHQQ